MFGESDSESPRVPSPWDSLTSTPPTTPPVNDDALTKGIPRLVPEAEEGNVEYKLQLLSPSEARFARLVTQLKWRLLEGGGQAYYELGVADSGALVGLPRQQLEESLLTLDMMASEIGASVIVVKEIEVPPELSGIAESQLEKWDGRRSARRKDLLRMIKQDSSPSTSTTEFETEFWTTDVTDAEENSSSPATSPPTNAGDTLCIPSESSPQPMPFDSPLAIFPMDGDDDVADFADNEAPDERTTDSVTTFSVHLEISFVYKPRPTRRRPNHVTFPPPNHRDKRRQYMKKKHKNGFPPSNSIDNNLTADGTCYSDAPPKAQHHKDRRDKGPRLETNALLTHVPTHNSNKSVDDFTQHSALSPSSTTEALLLVSDLESLHVTVIEPLSCVPPIDTAEHEDVDGGRGTTAVAAQEPRLIVEALVVRKLSADEVFLDFEAFSF